MLISTLLNRKVTLLAMLLPLMLQAAPKPRIIPPVEIGEAGKLVYISDSLGNRIPDYSYCGYKASNEVIPMVDIKAVVPIVDGDATSTIQSAIDYVASLPVDANGFRGAILLDKGTYKLSGRLRINTSGIVLRGSGFAADGTVVIAAGLDRETLIRVKGGDVVSSNDTAFVSDDYVPVNALSFNVDNASLFKIGDEIFITRPSTKTWINSLEMNEFGGETAWLGWKPGQRDIVWSRTITGINGNTITVDAPLTTALDKSVDGSFVVKHEWNKRVENVGIENLSFVSEYNSENPKDEDHCWNSISFENARNCWVRQARFTHFAGSAVAVYKTASCVTVEDCFSLQPISEIGGLRRRTFFTEGQQTLFQRIYAEFGMHDFSTGFCVAGPNAFVQCESHLPFSFSGTVDSWASGVLFDIVNVDGQSLSFLNRGMDDYGAGWTAANSMLWQCSASSIDCFKPYGAQNWAFGTWGQFSGNGYWYESNSHVNPRSLFYAQLSERIGSENIPQLTVMITETNATSSPRTEQAAEIVAMFARTPAVSLRTWLENAPMRQSLKIEADNAKIISVSAKADEVKAKTASMSIKNGVLLADEELVTGSRCSEPWWSGNMRPLGVERASLAITRFVPGLTGKGYTDDIESVASNMKASNIVALEHNYALWYERRRDDHERIRRANGECWAPFYELPFARTGQGLAWDGLSKYDLTKYNPWYWNRLKTFADIADREGLMLIHQNYFQHNILEAGAHWVDSPWRTTNNVNNTDFPEPPPFAGDKRIFIAEDFYDINHPVRRELHRKYIRQCLDNFKDNSNVLQLTSAEYTGPLHFVQFWIDVVAEWQKETGVDALIGLSATKDVQDSILSDPIRSKIIDVIDIRYWSSKADGSLYAPKGGLNLAPRQHARLEKTGKRSFSQVYSDVLTYRTAFPDKAVMYSENKSKDYAWAVFMAGGSLANIPNIDAEGFKKSASSMKVTPSSTEGQWMLRGDDGKAIIYSTNGGETIIEAWGKKRKIVVIDPQTGKTVADKQVTNVKTYTKVDTKGLENAVVWVF